MTPDLLPLSDTFCRQADLVAIFGPSKSVEDFIARLRKVGGRVQEEATLGH